MKVCAIRTKLDLADNFRELTPFLLVLYLCYL